MFEISFGVTSIGGHSAFLPQACNKAGETAKEGLFQVQNANFVQALSSRISMSTYSLQINGAATLHNFKGDSINY